MYSFLFFTQIILFSSAVKSWEVAVASEGQLEFMNVTDNTSTILPQEFEDLTAIAFDPVHQIMFLSNSNHTNNSVSIFQLDVGGSHELTRLVHRKGSVIPGLAYDSVSSILYWTDGSSVFWMNMTHPNGSGEILLRFHYNEEPWGIAVDSCHGFLFWTNHNHRNATIERSRLDGSNHEVLVREDVFQPVGIVVDQQTDKLIWCDNSEGIYYKIKRSNLDGSYIETILEDKHQSPVSITVGPKFIYWSDWTENAVWSIPKNDKDGSTVPKKLQLYQNNSPRGIAAWWDKNGFDAKQCYVEKEIISPSTEYQNDASTTQTEIAYQQELRPVSKEQFCLNEGVFLEKAGIKSCRCAPGYTGIRCDLFACHNYCVRGSCYIDEKENPSCRCLPGHRGERCELDVCDGYCLHGGRCTVQSRGGAACECEGGYKGRRCEDRWDVEQLWKSLDWWDICLAAACVVLLAIITILVKLNWHYRKRPRIKKRIIVNKNVTPLTSRPVQPGEQCEITIENCCNMNVCETPCFEPQLRSTKSLSKNDEKKNLLGNMEDEASCLPDQDGLY
uniref:Protein cueball n=2 Tax=Timema TaxID=61471 RepID=A0A7R9PJJ0_TIMGE|nr:unnamed protein product [Timema genevievae]